MSAAASDPAIPAPELLFPIVRDHFGPRLALVFGNEAPLGECPFCRAGHCRHCDIGLGEGVRFDAATNRRRLAWYRAHYAGELPRVAHLVVYNSGSVLDPLELSPEFLDEVLQFARGLPALAAVSLDSREVFFSEKRLVAAARILGAPRRLYVILGVESSDDAIREDLLDKRMSRQSIERAIAALGRAARALAGEPGAAGLGLEVNVVIGAPGAAGERSAADARDTARFAAGLAERAGVPLGLNLPPHYPSARGLARFPDHPRPGLAEILAAIEAVRAEIEARGGAGAIFVGLHDEGHDVRPDERSGALSPLVAVLDRFHREQEPAVLRGLLR